MVFNMNDFLIQKALWYLNQFPDKAKYQTIRKQKFMNQYLLLHQKIPEQDCLAIKKGISLLEKEISYSKNKRSQLRTIRKKIGA